MGDFGSASRQKPHGLSATSGPQICQRVQEHTELVPVGYDGFAMSRPRHEFEADTVRVCKEGRVVVVVVLRVLGRRRGLDPQLTKEAVGFVNRCSIPDLKADVMQPHCVGIVTTSGIPCRPDRILERAIVAVGVAISGDGLVALAEAERPMTRS